MNNINPTEEQSNIIKESQSGRNLVVDACAGSGKTSVLKMIAEELYPLKILYLVYNRAPAIDAREVFPSNVEVRTTHSLAWSAYKGVYGDRLLGPSEGRGRRRGAPLVPVTDTARMLGITEPLHLGGNVVITPYILAQMAVETVDAFACSASPEVEEKHIPRIPLGMEPAQEKEIRSEVRKWATKLWMETIQPNSSHSFTFEYAFKLFAFGGSFVNHHVIMIDEAQDSNETVEFFAKKQSVQTIVVGDPAQSLYTWRGAVNIMNRFQGKRLPLSQSWRFGEAIAHEANKHLQHTGTSLRVKGNPSIPSVVTDDELENPDIVLCPTNSKVMQKAIEYLEEGRRVAVGGGTNRLKNLAFASGQLLSGKPVTHPELAAFSNWEELVAFTSEPRGHDLKPLVGLVHRYGVSGIIDACNQMVSMKRPSGPEGRGWLPPQATVATVHQAKGLEYESGQMNGFKEPVRVDDYYTGETYRGNIKTTDAMTHYVATTRVKKHLGRSGLSWIDDYV